MLSAEPLCRLLFLAFDASWLGAFKERKSYKSP